MEDRYSRNRLYISNEGQEIIKDFPIILGGSGIGSVIAECALRLGFEQITIVDADYVEISNLNRQNYTHSDITKDKTEAIKNRLLSINPNANIKVHNNLLTSENVSNYIEGHKLAINALDFSTDVPLIFDKLCQESNIPILHPYNLGWGGLVAVISPGGMSLEGIRKPNKEFNEVDMVEYVTNYLKFWKMPHKWIDEILEKYKNEPESLPPPQLSIASWTVASMCTHIMYNLALENQVKEFPEFYLSTLMNSF